MNDRTYRLLLIGLLVIVLVSLGASVLYPQYGLVFVLVMFGAWMVSRAATRKYKGA